MQRTELSKREMRHRLAKLPVAEKLRLLEQLRDEELPKQNKRISKSQEKPPESSKSLLLEIIQQIVQKEPSEKKARPSAENRTLLDAEVEKLLKNRAHVLEALVSLFPEGLPINSLFFERLYEFYLLMGWGDNSKRLVGEFWSCAIGQLSEVKAETLLRELPRISNPYFFQLLDSLNIVIAERALRPEFVAEWFPALLQRIGNDLASGGFWKALEIYCDFHSESALEVLQILLNAKDDQQISVASCLLGSLRSLDTREKIPNFSSIQGKFNDASAPILRKIYNNSWVQTAWRGTMCKSDLEALTKRMLAGSDDEKEQVFWIVCRSLRSESVSDDCREFGLHWLHENTSHNISPVAKYNVIDFAVYLTEKCPTEAQELVLAAQPVAAEYKGIWQSTEQFLVHLLKNNVLTFNAFCTRFADKNAAGWLQALQVPRNFEWLLQEMQGAEVGDMVALFVTARNTHTRQLGLFFYDKLGLTLLPEARLNAMQNSRLRMAFHQLQLDTIQGRSAARFLIALLPYMQRLDDAFQQEFYTEVLLQSKNYGACREEFKNKSLDFPVLQTIVNTANQYFDALRNTYKSSINSIYVPGFQRSSRLHSRRFSNQVSKGADEYSIFRNLFKNVQLLYGKSWSSFYDGKLGEKSDLQTISTSYEMPRLEFIDPENMTIRRFHAIEILQELDRQPIEESK